MLGAMLLPVSTSCEVVVQDEDDHVLEAMLGFPLFTDGEERLGWLMNLNAVRTCSHAPLPEPNKLYVNP